MFNTNKFDHFNAFPIEFQMILNSLEGTKPPFKCPFCLKIYKSLNGIKAHLNEHQIKKCSLERRHISHNLDFFENYIDVDINGSGTRFGVNEAIRFIKDNSHECIYYKLDKKRNIEINPTSPPLNKLPDIQVTIVDDFSQPLIRKLSKNIYYRYFEPNNEEFEDEIQYDIDDEDSFWLEEYNKFRRQMNLEAINIDTLEWTIDRFEKNWYFKKVFPLMENGEPSAMTQDEDALCCICLDGECHQNNTILFCDLCNLAVHQECYGVPHIPDGPWICRRCLLSPSKAVACCLCPSKTGAFKQTDDGRWAHVICALFVPDVGFANPVFLEPIDGIERVAPARWKLTCQVCHKRRIGACIQCHRPTCYSAFHATCAQLAGFHLKLDHNVSYNSNQFDGIRSPGLWPGTIIPRRSAYCEMHSFILPEDHYQQEKYIFKKKDLRILEGNLGQILSIPCINKSRLQEMVKTMPWLSKKNSENDKYMYIKQALAYWKLKRKSRNGVPLCCTPPSRYIKKFNAHKYKILSDELTSCKTLRRDLEKVRLLNELIKKREKLKIEKIYLMEEITFINLDPFNVILRKDINNPILLENSYKENKLLNNILVDNKPVVNILNNLKNSIFQSSKKISKKLLMHQFLKEKYVDIDSSAFFSSKKNINFDSKKDTKKKKLLKINRKKEQTIEEFHNVNGKSCINSMEAAVITQNLDDFIPLTYFDLVWAKCFGFPWYPAIIIDPKVGSRKYQHNNDAVYLPTPSTNVLNSCKPNHFLVCFFDSKRSWQWLPRRRLDHLGVDSGLDSIRLKSSKSSNIDRKSVIQAYKRAIQFKCVVTGQDFSESMSIIQTL